MPFPADFLWGTATAAHQVEGNNIGSDCWVLENTPGGIFVEPSGDACDHYRLYRQDIALLAELGFSSYRFSVEWARIEPEDGRISHAALAHYRDVLEACHEFGLTPVVTLHHFTSPRWIIKLGGWEWDGLPERFGAYCRTVMAELGELIPYVCTINEANIAPLIRSMMSQGKESEAPVGVGDSLADIFGGGSMTAGAEALGTTPDNLNIFMLTASEAGVDVIRRAHVAAREAVRAVSPHTKVGITLAFTDFQALEGGEAAAEALWDEHIRDFVPVLDGDDFLGVQNYTRRIVGADGRTIGVPEGAETTQMGYEFYPQALEGVLRKAAGLGLPMMVTENGVAVEDDTRREVFIRQALEGVERCLADGVDVRGYFYWSALDNFEWMLGYRPTFGLVAVDRTTQQRTAKGSARMLGDIARRGGLG